MKSCWGLGVFDESHFPKNRVLRSQLSTVVCWKHEDFYNLVLVTERVVPSAREGCSQIDHTSLDGMSSHSQVFWLLLLFYTYSIRPLNSTLAQNSTTQTRHRNINILYFRDKFVWDSSSSSCRPTSRVGGGGDGEGEGEIAKIILTLHFHKKKSQPQAVLLNNCNANDMMVLHYS